MSDKKNTRLKKRRMREEETESEELRAPPVDTSKWRKSVLKTSQATFTIYSFDL